MAALRAAASERQSSPSLVRRYREMAAVLVRHGLDDVVDVLHLRRYLAWGSRALRGHAAPSRSRAARVRSALEELGPTFVKFGQALSVRSDLLPAEYVRELVKLQDQAAPLPPGAAEAALETALGRPVQEVFRSFDSSPVAAASIAQVHAATLPSGEEVVVKVRRPGIDRIVSLDVEMLRHLAYLVERYVPGVEVVRPTALVEEFARTIHAELDLWREGRNIERCASNFAGDATVRLPRVYWDCTASGVLTLERLAGVKLSGLEAAGVGPFARRLIARRGADAVMAQVLSHGFFHADPHPGNLLVLPGYVIGFMDFGIVGHLDDRARRELARVVRAIARRDAEALADLAIEITESHEDVDTRVLERDLAALIDTYGDLPIGDLSATAVLTDVVAVAARHRLRMPSNLMLLIKALVTIEAVGAQIDPTFRMIAHAAPVAERLWREEYAPAVVGRRAARALEQTFRALRALPLHVEAIARKVRDGRLEIRFVHRNLDHFVREMDRASNRIAFALVIAALVVGSSLIIHAGRGATLLGYPTLGLAGFVVAGVFGVGLAIGIVRSGRL